MNIKIEEFMEKYTNLIEVGENFIMMRDELHKEFGVITDQDEDDLAEFEGFNELLERAGKLSENLKHK